MDWSGVGTRLRETIESSDMSIRAFQRALGDRFGGKISGTSMPSLYRYLSGEVPPSADFIFAAADILNIRPEWLLTGRGDPYPEQALLLAGDQKLHEVHENIKHLPPAVQALLRELSVRFLIAWMTNHEKASERNQQADFEQFTLFALELALLPSGEIFGIYPNLDHRQRQNFAIQILSVLLHLTPGHTHPMPSRFSFFPETPADSEGAEEPVRHVDVSSKPYSVVSGFIPEYREEMFREYERIVRDAVMYSGAEPPTFSEFFARWSERGQPESDAEEES